ncbi:MAG: DUF4923 family protein [Bacteroidales bacterium]|nr:DUF4923 family protein [Bacteroidales bacterium]
MKKSLILILSVFITLSINAQFNLGSLIDKVSNKDGESKSSSIGDVLNNLVSNTDVDLSQLVGTWNYSGPAVVFQSDNALKSLGGSVASSSIESKLKSLYNKTGFDNLVLTINEDGTFKMDTKYAPLSGTIEKSDDGVFVFRFNALKSKTIGKLKAYTKLSGKTLSLTFDISKLVDLAKKVSASSNNSTIKNAVDILNSYDGVTAGFKLNKQ